MPEERIYLLTELFFKGEITEEENAELAHLVSGAEDDAVLAQSLLLAWREFKPSPAVNALADKHLQDVPGKILAADRITATAPVKLFSRTLLRIAAIFLLVITGLLTWFIITQHKKSATPELSIVSPDLPPGGARATLTLSNGSVIVLDSGANGNIASQGDVRISKSDGKLTYTYSHRTPPAEMQYNTVTTPRGGEFSVVLPDGSRVWLNAESSIRFPASFAAEERRVEISGEVYLEVKPIQDKKTPFIVEIKSDGEKKGEVTVLGTKFNVNAYPNSPGIRTTLVEGKVKCSSNNQSAILAPGQVGRISNGQVSVHPADTETVLAWHYGQFSFVKADIHEVMQQLERWYDIEVAYAGKIPDERFEGTIPRNSTIDEVFKILELSDLHVNRNGRKITVLP